MHLNSAGAWDDVQLLILVVVLGGLFAAYGFTDLVTRLVCGLIRPQAAEAGPKPAAVAAEGERPAPRPVAPPAPGEPAPAPPAVGESGPTSPGLVIWQVIYGNKLLGAELALVLLMVYGLAFRGNGIPSLFWQPSGFGRLVAAYGTGLLIVLVFYVAFIVDPDVQGLWRRLVARHAWVSGVRVLWSYLATATFPFLAIAALPALLPAFRPQVDHCARLPVDPWWLGGVGATIVTVDLVARFRLFTRVQWRLLRVLGRANEDWPTFRDGKTGAAAAASAWNLLATFGAIFALSMAIKAGFNNAALLICIFLGLLAAIYCVLSNTRRLVQIGALLFLGFGLWANSYDYKLVLPGLGYPRPPWGVIPSLTYAPPEREPASLASLPDRPERPSSEQVLNNWLETVRARGAGAGPKPKPKLAVVAVSGGAIRAATWSAVVLTRLEREVPGFPDHLRLITGASGGMLGAAYYTTTLHEVHRGEEDSARHHARIVDDLSGSIHPDGEFRTHDFLTPVVAQLVLRDLPFIFWPGVVTRDRGVVLEEAWAEHTHGSLSKTTFAALRKAEEKGEIPSLVISPMIVEDGRRLLISNLDLDDYTHREGSLIDEAGNHTLSDPTRAGPHAIYSRPAVEFFRLFPDADQFTVATAVRMNASFPYVSPAVCLPTRPSRRVVDAGYYDNYGVNLAAAWILHNAEWLAEHTSGVVLIQVRAFRNEEDLRNLSTDVALSEFSKPAGAHAPQAPRQPGAGEHSAAPAGQAISFRESLTARLARGAQFLTSPVDGFSSARTAINYYRNDSQVEAVSEWFRSRMYAPDFFTTVIFTCDTMSQPVPVANAGQQPQERAREAAKSTQEETLSWVMGLDEKLHIVGGVDPCTKQTVPGGMDRASNKKRLDYLKQWWSDDHRPEAQGDRTESEKKERPSPWWAPPAAKAAAAKR